MHIEHFKLTWRSISNKVLALLFGSSTAQLLKVITLLLLARHLGAEAYGIYVALLSVTTISAIIFNLGLNTWLIREVTYDQQTLSKLTGTTLAIKVIFGLVWLMLLSSLFRWLALPTFPPSLVRLMAVVVWFDSVLITGLTVFKAFLRNYLVSVFEASVAFSLLIGTVLFIYSNSVDLEFYIQIRLCIFLISSSVAWLLIWRWWGLHVKLSQIGQILRQVFPFASSEMLAWLSTRADVTLIAFILGSYYVGLYSPSVSLISALYFIPGAIFWVMVPILTNLFTTNSPQFTHVSKTMTVLLGVLGLGLTVAVMVGSNLFVDLLGPTYTASKTILGVISFVLTFKGISFAMAIILVSVGKQASRTTVQTVSVLVNIILNLMVLQIWGITGAAVVYVITEAILMAGYIWYAWPYLVSANAMIARSQVEDEVIS